jgi:hypothetical protein
MSADEIASIRESLHRIEQALVGDPQMGHKGIAQRLSDVEKTTEEHSRKLWIWTGMGAGIGVALSHIKSKIFG